MANTNVLINMRCPKCGSEGPFKIRATKVGMALVTDNGIEEHEGDTEWFDNSKCVCMTCGEDAELRHFKDSDERRMIDRAFDSVSKEDSLLITKIAVRAKDVCRLTVLTASIDLALAHFVQPLRLADLLAAPAMDFEHDVIGIYNEIDRETGSLGVFQPRYAEVKR